MNSDKFIIRALTSAMVAFGLATAAHAGPKDFDRGEAELPAFITNSKSSSKPATTKPTKKAENKNKKRKKKKKSAKQKVEFHKADWDYKNPSGWANIKDDYHLCSKGARQSPIDITTTKQARLGSIKFNYTKGPKNIFNNGHTIQVNMNRGNHIVVSGKRYDLLQFHFHTPSEHTIDGKPTDMVAHFVHKAADGELVVVAVLFKACQENDTIAKIWRRLPSEAGEQRNLSSKINVLKMFPRNRGYYQYAGSLTTPPCSEGVKWMVLKNTVPISDAQVKSFADLIPNNVRPVQDKFHRVILSRN